MYNLPLSLRHIGLVVLFYSASTVSGAEFAGPRLSIRPPDPVAPFPPAAPFTPPPTPVPVAKASRADYRLSGNDILTIKVFQEEELDTTVRVGKDGSATLPLIGVVNVGGRTVQECAQVIETKLREYLVQPQVTVRITEYSKHRFTVLGQVAKPGAYAIPDDATINLLEAIGMAGGYSRIANPAKVTVKRKVNGQEVTYKIDAKRMARDPGGEMFEVLAGDTILIGESLI